MATLGYKNFDAKQWYLTNFEKLDNGQGNGEQLVRFHEMRKSALSRFAELGFPTPRNEEWKYTNVAPILGYKFQRAPDRPTLSQDILSDFIFEGLEDNLLVFVNGQFSAELSTFKPRAAGAIVSSLKDADSTSPDILEKHLGRVVSFDMESFTALNTAFTEDGTFIFVPKNTVVEEPIQIVNLSTATASEFVAHPRKLVIAGSDSQLQFIESFHRLSESTYFNNQVTEIVLDEGAKVDHVKVQQESHNAFHVANTQVHQERSSFYCSTNVDLGGALVRNNLGVMLNGENCETHLFGFYLAGGNQHIDNHTFIDHAQPRCFSNELYKGILDGRANAVFNGKIMVRPDAQKTNALQSNKTLLLTNEASVNAKPQLEIFADDVKCTHGATIGQLDEEALFYLRARGIPEDVAAAMLRYAFAGDVFENIKVESVRKKLESRIIERLKNVEQA